MGNSGSPRTTSLQNKHPFCYLGMRSRRACYVYSPRSHKCGNYELALRNKTKSLQLLAFNICLLAVNASAAEADGNVCSFAGFCSVGHINVLT